MDLFLSNDSICVQNPFYLILRKCKSPVIYWITGLFLFGDISWSDFSQKKDIALRRCLLCGLLTKKDIALRRCLLFGVPGRTRTVDIQRSAAGRLQGKNHKQVVELPRTPVSIGISALLRFAFASILRRISAELYLNIISNLETSSSLENAYSLHFKGMIF